MKNINRIIRALCALILNLFFPHADAAIGSLKVQTTATQAVLSFTADGGPCIVQVYETGSSSLVHDVNPVLFPGSQLDSRENLRHGDFRQFVVGRRVAEKAADGLRYSRALQAFTEHDYVITCGSSVKTGRFHTTNIPTGQTFMESVPADPLRPGEYAYPDIDWVDRDQKIIDPQTGVLIRHLSMPVDYYEEFPRGLLNPTQSGNSWSSTQELLTDDSAAATYSGTDQGWLHIPFNFSVPYSGGSLRNPQSSMNILTVTMNAWCSGANCSSASPSDRTIEMCLTIDGVNCTSDTIEKLLEACTSGCTGSANRFTVGNGAPLMADWFTTKKLDFNAAFAHRRSGTVDRNGTTVTWKDGNKFSIRWTAGSQIEINGTAYQIAKVDSDLTITLASAAAGTETSVGYSTSNFRLLVRKKTASAHQIALQHVSWLLRESPAVYWAAGGDQEFLGNCSFALVPGPGGELGWHCRMGFYLYWIGKDSGKSVQYGWTNFPYREGTDGWWSAYCLEAFLDKADPNVLYCPATSHAGDTIILEARYHGSHQPLSAGTYQVVPECSGTVAEPCWTLRNLTPSSQGLSLTQQVAAFHPDFQGFKVARAVLVSQTGPSNALQFHLRRDFASNDNLTFSAVFDVATQRVIAANPSWKYYPARWSPIHGGSDISDASSVMIGTTFFRGPFQGTDNYAGNGPYLTTITSGPVTTTPSTCPARPADSPIAADDWPTGENCLEVSVDGEPADPTPAKYQAGTVSTSGTTVTGSGTNWSNWHNGGQMKIAGAFYSFAYVSPSQGVLTPAPPPVTNSTYELFLEPVNNPKVGSSDYAYLQDAEVRDMFCGTANPGQYFGGCGLYFQTEFFRLIIKNGNTWTLQRAFPGHAEYKPFMALPANAKLVAMPPSCRFEEVYPCAASVTFWNFREDPYGQSANGATLLFDRKGGGSGHYAMKPGLDVGSVAQSCLAIDGDYYRCYNARIGNLPEILNAPNLLLSLNPAFNGRAGIGSPNSVDSHPSRPQAFSRIGEPPWFLDGRPFNGSYGITGDSGNPGVRIEGDLYKFLPSQFPRLRPKHMPTLATCGYNPLVNVSGPASTITGLVADSYRYCVANSDGECRGGSLAGDVYVNCPMISRPYCEYAGVGNSPGDTREICIGDNGVNTEAITQTGVVASDMTGKHTRVLTRGLAWQKLNDVFWNIKGVPDGKWLVFRNPFAGGLKTEVFIAKIPPYPAVDNVNRSEYLPLRLKLGQPATDVAEVVVEFGYDPQFRCTARNEGCVSGTGGEYKYWSEPFTAVPCAGGCEVPIPAIAQRVVYYRIHYRDASHQVLSVGPTEVIATP